MLVINSKPHICFVALTAHPLLANADHLQEIGGAELQQVLIARGLVARGYRVSMICLDYGQNDAIEIDGIRVLRAYRRDQGLPVIRFFWPRIVGLWRGLKRADADIYYWRGAGKGAGIVAAFCRRYSKRSIFAAANNPNLEKKSRKVGKPWDRAMFEFGVRNMDCVLVQNPEQARLCREVYERDPILVASACLLPLLPRGDSANQVLWVSTLRKHKRPELFLELAMALPDYQFTMVGGPDGEDPDYFHSIKRRASGIPNLCFLGYVPYQTIGDYFDLAKVFVNTSEHEGFPNSFLQAWSRRVPTISFVDVGALMDGTPIGLRVESFRQLVGTVSRLMCDDNTRLSLGATCLRYVEMQHSIDSVLDHYELILNDVMNT